MTQQLSSSSSSQNINRVTFSQKDDVLIISELENCSPFEPSLRPDLIKKISVQFADHSVQEFWVDKSGANNFPARSHSFNFCVQCSSRFLEQADFLAHCDQTHSVQVQETGDLTLMTSDHTILNGYSKPEEMASSSMASQFMMNMSQQMLNGELMKFMRAQQFPQNAPFVQRNSSKTLKCPKCNWHYKYQETLEIHMKEKHNDLDVKCIFCLQNQAHPKLARGESYSCGYKPYRCELCKYSTTTKGNLSIHMQSDKHLHAVQEMPSNIGQQTPMNPLEMSSDKVFSCLICNNFRTNSSAELLDHLDRDRNNLTVGDVSMINGFYHCHLCPYNTNLKANFQLHTKTDKHIQRVQLINHMRENSGPITPNSLMNRLAAAKTTVQVRCGVCQEILTCTTSLREHVDSRIHLHRASVLMLHSASANPSPGRRGSALISSQNNPGGIEYECVNCGENFDDQGLAAAHIPQCSQTSNNEDKASEPSTSNAEWTANAERLMSMGEVAFYCKDCDFLTATLEQLQSHEKAGDHSSPSDPRPCPLCTRKPNTPLKSHLLDAHNIADEVAEELMASIPISASGKEIVGLYRHRCAHCPLVFKHGEQLKSHELTHSFRVNHKCPNCTRTFSSVLLLLQHQQDEHSELKCELCSATFGDKQGLDSHLGSVEHLNRTKQFLEDQPNKLQLNEKVMQLLQRSSEDRESPSDKPKPYKCNVCKLNYSQGSTLDIHLRSVGHQNRMNRLNELVKCGEIDASKPVSEQPGGIPQKPIGDLVDNEKADASDMNSTENPVNFMNILNMAQFMQLAQNPSTSATDSGLDLSENNGIDLSSILNGQDSKSEEKPKPRKLGQDFRRSLEGYGFELVAQFVDDLKKEKIDFIPDNEILELRQQFDDINKNSVPIDGIQQFAENLKKAVDEVSDDVLVENEDEDGPPEPKRARSDNPKASGQKLPEAKSEFKTELMSQMMNLPFMNNNPFVNMSPDMFQAAFASMLGSQAAPDSPSPNSASQKRARTRITDDQLKILRQYFDINNSPTELQIKEMSNKTGLPEKVIKHWFRNTLFKERQRDKNSPYNFNVQPMMRIDLDTYEKTGEAKIINLKDEEDQKPDEKSDSGSKTPEEQTNLAQDVLANLTQAAAAFNQIPNYAALAGQNPFASFLEQESSQMNQNPLAQLMNGFNSVIPMVSQQSKSSGNSTGRRANRTRFTDFQLRTLQEFFDRQAYPKDDDLEMLSKKLSLSPRVIVVWFQNARQKARKIYENQPNQDNTDRFIRTPGCNFQCKRCQLVFQRYYELIQHQQRVCYANDTDAQNTDNKSVEENMTEEERQKPVSSSQTEEDKRKDSHDNNNTPQDLLKLITGAADSEALMKMFANQAQHKKFSKRCPFCANLFTSKDAMSNHIAHQHSDNPLATTVNVDNLPEADESLSTTEGLLGTISALTGGSPLDLRQKDPRKSSSPFDDLNDNQEADEFSSNGSFDFRALSASPHALLSAFGSPLGSAMGSGMQRSPANGSSASQGGPKRYRTHLTPLQVYVMKSLFTDYKTPSMSECEVLGREIGLHKRVVQVWFQNARAKQRKCGMGAITEEGLCSTHPTGCVECGIDFNGRLTIQDHIFSSQHIGKVKEKGAELRGNEEPIERPKSMKREGEDGGPSEDVALNPLLYTLMDPNMLGTPIQCLQIPEKVMTQIAADLAKGNSSTVFTQDGLELPNLALKVSDEDFKCGTIVESEVGWACPQCSQVFQQEMWLKNHQKLICQGCDGVFRLIQQHYECIPCGQKFGTQDDYRSHCDQSSHKAKRQVFQSPSTCSTSSV